jgi:hypothetical protein
MSNRCRSLVSCGSAALAFALALAPTNPIAHAATPQDVTLGGARVDALDDGRIVISFQATGAVRGLLTLQIQRKEDAVRGQWVLVSRYLQDLTPEGEVDERAQEVRAALPGDELHLLHREYITIRERGTLRGSIAGGALDFDVDGRLRSIGALDLRIDGGSLEFEGRTGSAALTASSLHDGRGTGTLRLSVGSPAAQEVK